MLRNQFAVARNVSRESVSSEQTKSIPGFICYPFAMMRSIAPMQLAWQQQVYQEAFAQAQVQIQQRIDRVGMQLIMGTKSSI